tara:strand:+ start:275 stop:637 length:363 start_codon:yes stop_codon:yes gene_type:complete
MMQPHRRSNRRPRNNKTTKDEVEKRVQAFIEANRVENLPGKLYIRESKNQEEDTDELVVPWFIQGFEYDKEMYMANDRYASMVQKELAEAMENKLWNDAQENYAEDEADHKDKFEGKSCD